jgi:DNA polymerase I
MAAEKKLFLLDGMALIYRAYFAFSKNPRVNSKGVNTSAMFGFTNTLLDVLKKENPTHIAVSFDTEAPTGRHEEFTDYKANRDAMPEDLANSIPYIYKIIEGFRIPVIVKDGYEADDIIGTLAKAAEKKGFKVYMMTPDKDFGQLVSDNIFIYKPPAFGGGAEVLGVEQVLEKFEIKEIKQVIDILGLWGDSVDNIPGIPGVGEKTAKKLIAEFGSVENVIANAENIKGKLGEKVKEYADQALLSKQLATIITDAPVQLDEKALELEPPDKDLLREVFDELEFRTLTKRVLDEEGSTSPVENGTQQELFEDENTPVPASSSGLANIHTTKHEYFLCDSAEKRLDRCQPG